MAYSLRLAEHSDIGHIIESARDFVDQTRVFRLDEEYFGQIVARMIDSESHILVMSSGGGHCIGVLFAGTYSYDPVVRVLSTWGKGGLACFDAVLDWARMKGATHLMADSLLDERMGSFYQRRGMIPVDQLFLKVL